MAGVIYLSVLLSTLRLVRGQDPPCSVIPTLLNNDKGDSPCQIFSDLMGAPQCSGFSPVGAFTTQVLATPTALESSSSSNTLQCWCSTVSYYLFTACSSCQGLPQMTWSDWIGQCSATGTSIAVGYFPGTLPHNISIPAWAMVESTGDFSVSTADAIASLGFPDTGPVTTLEIELTTNTLEPSIFSQQSAPSFLPALPTSAAGGAYHSSGTVTVYASTTSTPLQNQLPTVSRHLAEPTNTFSTPSDSHGASVSESFPIAPVIGGVVGGIILVLVSICLVCLLWRKRRRSRDHFELNDKPAPLLPLVWLPGRRASDDSPISPHPISLTDSTSSVTPSVGHARGRTPPPEYADLSRSGTMVLSTQTVLPSPVNPEARCRHEDRIREKTVLAFGRQPKPLPSLLPNTSAPRV
ncbi:hypothetical protein DACRYDRAFT_106091 [Dacryopinax primogenitus]|uniref:Mid2 domain-containing protein n=1 Tax=Dacryopinax primogenitus (strain DJM 731) TaxID=1858805 RepID=M5G107_DACPD|nr:uncharacterized protein DACRYDRAFT_106091 [Dacryopinax primogenitus]EJU03931.1 hypothetical protein DACRYDRAFT_106091 [Dacryopinax primogenitus]